MKKTILGAALGCALLSQAGRGFAQEAEKAAADAETTFTQAAAGSFVPERGRIAESCTWLQRQYKDELRARALAASQAASGETQSGKEDECAKLRGTARLHCRLGYDPHHENPPVAGPTGAEPEIANPCFGQNTPEARSAECRKVVGGLEERIRTLQGQIGYQQQQLAGLGGDVEGKERATDLSAAQRETLLAIEDAKTMRDSVSSDLKNLPQRARIPASWAVVTPEGRHPAKEETPARGLPLPEDYDCPHLPGRMRIPHCPPMR